MAEIGNVITAIAEAQGRRHVIPEDVIEALQRFPDDPVLVYIDTLAVIARQTGFGVLQPALIAHAAWTGKAIDRSGNVAA